MKVIIEADGGSRGNPGIAGSGTLLLDERGEKVLRRISEFVGKTTNNVAEYRGLINGLIAAHDLGATHVEVRLDSKLVVEQMSGRWKVKHPDMKKLALEARGLASRFEGIHYTWIPRKKNSRADELANIAMDAGADGAEPGKIDLGERSGDTPVVAEAGVTVEKDSSATATAAPTSWNGAVTRPTRMILLRHGQTEMSAERRYSGRGNPSLTAVGRRQAELAAAMLSARGGIDAIVSSPLARTRETAEMCAAALGLDVDVLDELTELDFGAWDGLTFGQARDADPELHEKWLSDTSVSPPGGESLQTAYRRIKRAKKHIVDTYREANVLVVSHVTPIKGILRLALDAGPGIFHRMHLDLASLSVAEFYADGPTTVRLVNETAHLR
ncbi:bifunctional RNase H/acid phosphatase [Corynebacterium sp. CCM 9185]|uniref:Bifunctional RNase H/acid phosphatase n=1 Tax=Corynebacterium marambiense TaxID=2765364 RepID=A0ABS0W031_9CORY|nr:bifunctional RNase H/acid phosphatase [Corynebacterium marambiense]MCK7662787.1 bifunctional RNase H/acid phosphatase [Corynebacterium marambiense]